MKIDLRARRLNRGLTLTDAAERMEVARNTLAAIEKGEQQPHAGTAFRIANFYGLQVTDIWPVEEAAA